MIGFVVVKEEWDEIFVFMLRFLGCLILLDVFFSDIYFLMFFVDISSFGVFSKSNENLNDDLIFVKLWIFVVVVLMSLLLKRELEVVFLEKIYLMMLMVFLSLELLKSV